MGVSIIASARDVAMRDLCVTLDQLADQPAVLGGSSIPDRDLLTLWPAFAAWIVGSQGSDDVVGTGLGLVTAQAPKIGAVLALLGDTLRQVGEREIPEKEWRQLRGNLGARSVAFTDLLLGKHGSERERTEYRPLVWAVSCAAEAGAAIAYTMYQYTQTANRVFEHPGSSALRFSALALGWRKCQAEWHPGLPLAPDTYWRPIRTSERRAFARRATLALFKVAR